MVACLEPLIECLKCPKEACHLFVPFERSGIVPGMLAIGESEGPIEQIAHVSEDLSGRARSGSYLERAEVRWCSAQCFAGAIRQSRDSVAQKIRGHNY